MQRLKKLKTNFGDDDTADKETTANEESLFE